MQRARLAGGAQTARGRRTSRRAAPTCAPMAGAGERGAEDGDAGGQQRAAGGGAGNGEGEGGHGVSGWVACDGSPSPLGEKVARRADEGALQAEKVAPHQFGQMTYVRAISAGANFQRGARGRKSWPHVLSPREREQTAAAPHPAPLPASGERGRQLRSSHAIETDADTLDAGAFGVNRDRYRLAR